MTIDDIELCEMDEQLAYILGMCYPLYKKKDFNNKSYIIGACNYNKIQNEELISHILAVKRFLQNSKSSSIQTIDMLDNSKLKRTKKGFSILIENNKEYADIFKKRVDELFLSNDKIKIMFTRGCFDGRASWDTTSHYISLDVDRDQEKKQLINNILSSVGIDLNINNRGENAKKNDQIRIRKSCVQKFLDDIGFFSTYRTNIIKNNIKLKDL